jgi:uncharacterized membrane protein
MASLSQAKTLGGIGAILSLLFLVPSAGAILAFAGFVMILLAVNYIAGDLKERKIFDNMMIAVILTIVGIAVASLVIVPTLVGAFQNGYFNGANFAPSANVTLAQWITFGTAIGLGLVAAWAFFLASSVFLRRSYKTIGARLNVHLFETAGLLYLIGAATSIVGIGFLILLVAQILTVAAFFSLPERLPEVTQSQSVTIAR